MRAFRVYCYFDRTDSPGFMLYQALTRIPGVTAFWFKPEGDASLFGRTDLHLVIAGELKGRWTPPHPFTIYDADLMPAYEPLIWYPRDRKKQYDLGFVGDPNKTPERAAWVEEQLTRFPRILVDWDSRFEDAAESLAQCERALVYSESEYTPDEMFLQAWAMEIPIVHNRDFPGLALSATMKGTWVHRALSLLRDSTGEPWTVDEPALLKKPPFEGTHWGTLRPSVLNHVAI